VRLRQFRWVAGIAQLPKLDSFDHTSGIHIQAGNDAFG
jgi:hypothetical protein